MNVRVLILLASVTAIAVSAPPIVRPFESSDPGVPPTRIDQIVQAGLRSRAIEPANQCSDELFIRRAYLDLIGTLPDPDAVRSFVRNKSLHKRAELANTLFDRPEFADYWSMKWCDILRVKSEFPINLWPNAVQAYHAWIRDAIKTNMPYDQFAKTLLTSSGSNFREPPVNFYRAIQGRTPVAIADAVALAFMGTRLDSWKPERKAAMTSFFCRIAYKPTAEWKEEIVCVNMSPTNSIDATLPDGTCVCIMPGDDPRRAFAAWLLKPGNPWFARAIANRAWSWFFGRGIIHEPDDIRSDNPPVYPELLTHLERELAASKYDLRHIFRIIVNSRTYQQSPLPRTTNAMASALFACYPVRRLDAEVLVDALNTLGGPTERYSSPIPEPFTYIPEFQRTIALADGSISSPFLELFGRPARDTGLESERNNMPSDAQRLHLLNSTDVQKKIEQGKTLRGLMTNMRGGRGEAVKIAYLAILSREPTPNELAAAAAYAQSSGLNPRQAADDLVWALINSKEFLYRH